MTGRKLVKVWTVVISGIGRIMSGEIHHTNRLKKKKYSHINRYKTCIW